MFSWLRKRSTKVSADAPHTRAKRSQAHLHAQLRILRRDVETLQRQVSNHETILEKRGRPKVKSSLPQQEITPPSVVAVPLAFKRPVKRPGVG
jgi:hypothetical protein